MSDQAKPAPTAAEVAAARQWLDEVTLSILKADGHEQTVDHVRTLLAALDAAEARADTAEKERDDARTVADESVARHRAWWQEAIRLHSALHSLATDDVHAHLGDGSLATESLCARNGIAALRTRAETAERERDEARDLARKLAQECIEALRRNCSPSLDLRDTDMIATWKESPRG